MGNGRRIRWAERENARLAADYQHALVVWEQDEQLIEWYNEQARSVRPLGQAEGLRLRGNEQVFWTAADVSMIEVPDNTSLFTPVHEVFSPTRDAGGYLPLEHAQTSVRDFGFVAVTESRVLFVGGRANREWTFAHLDGIAHGARAPMTLMRVGDRQCLSGLVFPADQATRFQFYLGLALAEYRHDRPAFVEHLHGLLVHHRRRPPLAPAPALPAQAPSSANLLARLYFGRPESPAWRKLMPAMVTVLGMFCLFSALLSPPWGRENTWAESRAPAAGPAAPATSAPATTPAASASPKAVNLCGAPPNPWEYDFCGGSSRVTEPPGEFCAYFNCVDNFWAGRGYVVQCKDNMFSKSGGVQTSCSSHQGNRRPLNR